MNYFFNHFSTNPDEEKCKEGELRGREDFEKFGKEDCLYDRNPFKFGEDQDRRNGYHWGWKCAADEFTENKYKVSEMHEKIRAIIIEHGLELVYSEYDYPYAVSPERQRIQIA